VRGRRKEEGARKGEEEGGRGILGRRRKGSNREKGGGWRGVREGGRRRKRREKELQTKCWGKPVVDGVLVRTETVDDPSQRHGIKIGSRHVHYPK
jgi:hypothetical protein